MDNDTRGEWKVSALVALIVVVVLAAVGLATITLLGGGLGAPHTVTLVDGGSAGAIEDVTISNPYGFEVHLSGPFDTSVREAYVVDDGDVNSITDVLPGQTAVEVNLGGLGQLKEGHQYRIVLLNDRGDVVDWALVEVTAADG